MGGAPFTVLVSMPVTMRVTARIATLNYCAGLPNDVTKYTLILLCMNTSKANQGCEKNSRSFPYPTLHLDSQAR